MWNRILYAWEPWCMATSYGNSSVMKPKLHEPITTTYPVWIRQYTFLQSINYSPWLNLDIFFSLGEGTIVAWIKCYAFGKSCNLTSNLMLFTLFSLFSVYCIKDRRKLLYCPLNCLQYIVFVLFCNFLLLCFIIASLFILPILYLEQNLLWPLKLNWSQHSCRNV